MSTNEKYLNTLQIEWEARIPILKARGYTYQQVMAAIDALAAHPSMPTPPPLFKEWAHVTCAKYELRGTPSDA